MTYPAAQARSAVQPIQELLHRIQWDESFGRADFVLGYYDRFEHGIIHVRLRDVRFSADNPSILELLDADGQGHSVPLHRVKEVYRNGELIWHRSH